ncbi:histone-lysine N-methyltransferase SETDB1-like [Glandiceps talaboti]
MAANKDSKMEISVLDSHTQTELVTFIDDMMLDLGRRDFLADVSKIECDLDTEHKKQEEISVLWDEVDGLLDQYRLNLERQRSDLDEITKEQQRKDEEDSIYTYSHYDNSSQGNNSGEKVSSILQQTEEKKVEDDSIYTYHYGGSNHGNSTSYNEEPLAMETSKSPEPDLSDLIDFSATDENIPMETDHNIEEQPRLPKIPSKPVLAKGMKLLGKRRVDGIWYEGTFLGNITDQNGLQKYKIKYDGNKGKSLLSGKSIAYTTNPHPWEVKVGSRIVGIYLNEADSHDECFYAGIVAETPMRMNGYRYLIFFDDGFAQYMRINKLYKVYEQSENVWEDIHPDSREFIKEYLEIYPERPMVKVKASQWIRTEWNGQWWKAKVLEVDGSLVNMLFEVDKRTEWIYRGSPRLETLFTELQHAEAARTSDKGIAHVRSRATTSKSKGPYVEYTRVKEEPHSQPPSSVLTAPSTSPSLQRPVPASITKTPTPPQIESNTTKHLKPKMAKKSTTAPFATKQETVKQHQTARKSTAAWKPQVFNQNVTPEQSSSSWEGPWLKRGQRNPARNRGSYGHQKTDIASVLQSRLQQDTSDDSNDSYDINVLQMLNQIGKDLRKIFVPHNCIPQCVANCRRDPVTLRGQNPFLKPELCGWRRELGKQRGSGRRLVSYRAPCGRSLRTLEEVDRYLLETKITYLTIDEFTFDPFVHSHTNIRNPKPIMVIKDISEGKEPIPVSCVNEIDERYPIFVEYTTQRICARGVTVNTDPEFLAGCDCTDNCRDRSKCGCQQLTIQATAASNKVGIADPEAGYENRLLYETIMTGIYECNSRCKCNHTCHNRVAQHGLTHRLQVFKTEKRGWGLRCLDDIPVGSFVCTYAGELLTEELANEDGKRYGDEYLAELDLIEVAETRKEGYESDVRDPETSGMSDSVDSSSEDESRQQSLSTDSEISSSQRTNQTSDSDSDYEKRSRTSKSSQKRVGKLFLRRQSSEKGSCKKAEEWTIEKPNKKVKPGHIQDPKSTKPGPPHVKDSITIQDDDSIYVFPSSTVTMETKSKDENPQDNGSKKTDSQSPDEDDCVLIEDVTMETKPAQSKDVSMDTKSAQSKDVVMDTKPAQSKDVSMDTKPAQIEDVSMVTTPAQSKDVPMVTTLAQSKDVAMDTKPAQSKDVSMDTTPAQSEIVTMETRPVQSKDSDSKLDTAVDIQKVKSELGEHKESVEGQGESLDKPVFVHEKRTKPAANANGIDCTAESGGSKEGEKKTELGHSSEKGVTTESKDSKEEKTKEEKAKEMKSKEVKSKEGETSQDELPDGLDVGDKSLLEQSLSEFFDGGDKGDKDRVPLKDKIKKEPCDAGYKSKEAPVSANKKPEADGASGKPTNQTSTECVIDLTLDDDNVVQEGTSSTTPTASASAAASTTPFNVEQSPRSIYGYNPNTTAKFVDKETLAYIKASRAKRRLLKHQDEPSKVKTTTNDTNKSETLESARKTTNKDIDVKDNSSGSGGIQIIGATSLAEDSGEETSDSDAENKKTVSANQKLSDEFKRSMVIETGDEGDKSPSTRLFYGEEHCYVMDAKSIGNLGRYLNHSCSPNLFVQNVFVDTHDLRFPWVAFFAQQFIRAGSELTWDYNYEVGSVPGKVLQCYCGSTECRGRLL